MSLRERNEKTETVDRAGEEDSEILLVETVSRKEVQTLKNGLNISRSGSTILLFSSSLSLCVRSCSSSIGASIGKPASGFCYRFRCRLTPTLSGIAKAKLRQLRQRFTDFLRIFAEISGV